MLNSIRSTHNRHQGCTGIWPLPLLNRLRKKWSIPITVHSDWFQNLPSWTQDCLRKWHYDVPDPQHWEKGEGTSPYQCLQYQLYDNIYCFQCHCHCQSHQLRVRSNTENPRITPWFQRISLLRNKNMHTTLWYWTDIKMCQCTESTLTKATSHSLAAKKHHKTPLMPL